MPGIIVVGTQWGDEGKGKATDQLGTQVDVVVKFNGGNNAGHTVVIGDETYTLHLLPAGILSESAVPVIGNGVVVDPEGLFAEIEAMEARGVDCSRLKISANAHVITRINRHHRAWNRSHVRGQEQPHRHPYSGPSFGGHPACPH